MSDAIAALSYADLLIALVPLAVVAGIYIHWLNDYRQIAYASARMVLQLLLVGFVLEWLFGSESRVLFLGVIAVMIIAAAAIALRPLLKPDRRQITAALLGLGVGGSLNLVLVMTMLQKVAPWYTPSLLIPLAGMVYANAMNAVSLAAERLQAEREAQTDVLEARNRAYAAGMLPQINSLLAVGLVALPGMMTGQILSGVSPLVAVRYQIMVMCMILGSAGIATAIYLWYLLRGAHATTDDA